MKCCLQPRLNGTKPSEAICVDCKNNTTGERCDRCREGHFRVKKDGKTLVDACLKWVSKRKNNTHPHPQIPPHPLPPPPLQKMKNKKCGKKKQFETQRQDKILGTPASQLWLDLRKKQKTSTWSIHKKRNVFSKQFINDLSVSLYMYDLWYPSRYW